MPTRSAAGQTHELCLLCSDRRLSLFEMPFIRFLHLLAHHSDFSRETDEIAAFAKYFELFFDCIANEENVGLLYHLCDRVRTVRDIASVGHSEVSFVMLRGLG
jgi:sister-chromatid-cohesion protein PDS5